jgi:glyoxylase-like metal-dependent hydrolase (beta-lactamase superfamily II)
MLLIPARNPSAWTGPTGNNTFLLTGAVPALIDAGVGAPEHLDDIAAALAGATLVSVLITHAHPDHASGLPALVARWPSVRVVRYPIVGSEPIAAGDTELRPVHTPGHAADHLCFFDVTAGDVYCGDLVRLGGTIVIPGSRGGNLRQYLDSLRAVRALAPRRLLPGHGAIISDPASVIDEYIRHRQKRERQVLDALRTGPSTPEEIAARVYARIAPGLLAAAADTVLAHLVYLEETGRAARSGNRWTAHTDTR